jgi:YgiT-type zinc finger domain-containing protein
MNTCVICKSGKLSPGKKTILVERGRTLVIFRDAPGDVCNQCSEIYFSNQTTDIMYQQATDVFEKVQNWK